MRTESVEPPAYYRILLPIIEHHKKEETDERDTEDDEKEGRGLAMGVVMWACRGRRRKARNLWVLVWAWVVIAGVWCVSLINHIRVTPSSTPLSQGHKAEKRTLKDDTDVKAIGLLDNLVNVKETVIKEERSKLIPVIKSQEASVDFYPEFKEKIQKPSESKSRNYTDTSITARYENRELITKTEEGKPENDIAKEAYKLIQNVEGRLEKGDGIYRSDVKLENDIGEEIKEENGEGKEKDDQKIREKTKYEGNNEDKKGEENNEGRKQDNQKIPEKTKYEANEDKHREGKQKHVQRGQKNTNNERKKENGENKREEDLSETELKPDQDQPVDSPEIEEKVTRKGESLWNSPLTFNGSYDVNETLNGRPVVKVMLVAYQRSGSSFTGELLASGGSTIYTFEPLFPWRRRLGPSADPALLRDAARLLGDMLDCRPEVIRKWQEHKFYYFRKKPADVKDFCKDASIRILKTIRARASFLLPWLAKRQDVKVIHLVRDPRGILSSVKRGQQLWSDNNRDIALQCANIKGDLSLETLGPQRYLRVEYEDLVDKQMEVTRLMFSFLGVPVTPSVEEYVKEHTHQDPDPTPVPQRYLNTYRDSEYRHDHWRNELDGLEVQHIQTVCREVMNLLHYPFVSPS